MPDIGDKLTRDIFGRSIIVGTTIMSEILDHLISLFGDSRRQWAADDRELLAQLDRVLTEFEIIFAEHLLYTEITAWIAGFDWTASKFPRWLTEEFETGIRSPIIPPDPPKFENRFTGDDAPDEVRFPKIEEAANRLLERNILTRDEFDNASDAAKERAFTVAGDITQDTIETVRDTLAEDIREGTSLEGFREKLRDNLKAGPFRPSHTETVYRTNVQAAFRDGRETLASNPIVSELFPYQAYVPIHDDRVRHTHLELGKLGLDGTGIYRRDDPFWDYFTPPWDYNCILPGSVIEGRIELLTRSKYTGEVVELVTRSGKLLRVTVNHPILTPQGFVAAGKIRKGREVFSNGVRENRKLLSSDPVFCSRLATASNDPRRSPPCMDEYDAPIQIEELFATLELKQELITLPVGPNDFYGDAARGDGKVDVVGIDSELRDYLYSPFSDCRQNLVFPFADPLALADRDRLQRIIANLPPSGSFPGFSALPDHQISIESNLRPLQMLRVGPASQSNARRPQPIRNHRPIDTVLDAQGVHRITGSVFGDDLLDGQGDPRASNLSNGLLLRNATNRDAFSKEHALHASVADANFLGQVSECLALGVTTDEVVEVRKFEWSGHVYDAQTEGGWFMSDGVIVSNCRCGVNLLTIDKAAAAGVREAQEWLATGRRPERPEWRLGSIPFDPNPGFGTRGRTGALVG